MKFRGKETENWVFLQANNEQEMTDKVAEFAKKFDFEDFQFAANNHGLYVAILPVEKYNVKEMNEEIKLATKAFDKEIEDLTYKDPPFKVSRDDGIEKLRKQNEKTI